MPTCPRCGGEYEAAALRRHERDGMVWVQCPDCGQRMGTYNSRGSR